MNVNNTYPPGNVTSTAVNSGPAVGLAVFFTLVVIVAGVMVYKYRGKIRNMLPFGHRESQMKEDHTETPQTGSHMYTSMTREPSVRQTPIYENLATRRTSYKSPEVNQSRSPDGPEEDLYLQCDLTDEAIYNNDPAYNLSVRRDSQEDVYIVPDS